MSDPWYPPEHPPPTQQIPSVPGAADQPTVGPAAYGPPGMAPPPVTGPGGPPLPPPPGGSGGRSGTSAATIVAVVLGVLAIVGAAVAITVVLTRSGSDDTATGTSTTTTTTTTTSTSTTTTTTTAPPITTLPAGPGDVRALQAGLFCRDLRAQGYSYSAAVDYWRQHGQPDQMDADRNGIPCETVYPRSDVVAYWGPLGTTPTFSSNNVYDLPSGLLCRDLKARGFDVYDAIAYYLNWGSPSNMDADHNGIPCETVYPDAYQAWIGGSGD